IVNQVASSTVALSSDQDVPSFYVLNVILRHMNFDVENVRMISELVKNKILFVLSFNKLEMTGVFENEWLSSGWKKSGTYCIKLKGLSISEAWNHILFYLSGYNEASGLDFYQVQGIQMRIKRIDYEISLKRKEMGALVQPNQAVAIFEEIKRLENESAVLNKSLENRG
ncbi:MAG: hypothetical protein WC117_05675, partial [Sphaerochaetaceae bacterium]